MTNPFILDGGSVKSASQGGVFLTPLIHRGVYDEATFQTQNPGYSITDIGSITKSDVICLMGALTDDESYEIPEPGGSYITGAFRGGTATSNKLYLGWPIVYDTGIEETGGITTAKLEKNGVTISEDAIGQKYEYKLTSINIASDRIREIMTASQADSRGVRKTSHIPNQLVFNKMYLMSYVSQLANGDFLVKQARYCRIIATMVSSGEGEYQKFDMMITPQVDDFANSDCQYMGEVIVSQGVITNP